MLTFEARFDRLIYRIENGLPALDPNDPDDAATLALANEIAAWIPVLSEGGVDAGVDFIMNGPKCPCGCEANR